MDALYMWRIEFFYYKAAKRLAAVGLLSYKLPSIVMVAP